MDNITYQFVNSRLRVGERNAIKEFAKKEGYVVIEEHSLWASMVGLPTSYLNVNAPWRIDVINQMQKLSPCRECLRAAVNGKCISLDEIANEYLKESEELLLGGVAG